MAAKEISVKKYVVRLSGEERERLETLIRKGKSPARRVLKARILLKADVSEAGNGWSDNRIIEALETSPSMVYRVRKQLVEEGFEAVLCRNARADPDESGTPGPFRLRVRAQWHRQSLHDVCSARRLAPRQGHRSPYRRGLRSRLERLGRHPLRARQDHRSGPGQSQHPQQGFTLRSLSGRRSQAPGRALRMALHSKTRQLARSGRV